MLLKVTMMVVGHVVILETVRIFIGDVDGN